MWTKNFIERSLILASLSALAIGCGGAPQTAATLPASTTPTIVQPASTIALPPPAISSTSGAYNYAFQLQNTSMSCNNGGTHTPSGVAVGTYTTSGISTDNIFKIKVSSDSYKLIPCTGVTAVYSCLEYTITVGARSQTVLLSYGNPQSGPCAGIPSSQTLDFSDQAGPGHGPLTVRVSQPQSDNCRTFGYPGEDLCGMAPLYSNYIAAGNLAITTNSPN